MGQVSFDRLNAQRTLAFTLLEGRPFFWSWGPIERWYLLASSVSHHHEGGLGWPPEEVAGSSEAAQTLGREAEGEKVHRTGPLSLFLCCFSVC